MISKQGLIKSFFDISNYVKGLGNIFLSLTKNLAVVDDLFIFFIEKFWSL